MNILKRADEARPSLFGRWVVCAVSTAISRLCLKLWHRLGSYPPRRSVPLAHRCTVIKDHSGECMAIHVQCQLRSDDVWLYSPVCSCSVVLSPSPFGRCRGVHRQGSAGVAGQNRPRRSVSHLASPCWSATQLSWGSTHQGAHKRRIANLSGEPTQWAGHRSPLA